MAGTGRGHPPGTAEPPRDGRAPARRTAPTDHAAVPSRRPRAGARERVWGRGGPPHTRGGEAQRRGESGMNPDPLRAGTGDREPAGRETTHRANGLGGRDGRRPPPDERRRRRGPGRREKTGPRACSQTRGGEKREGRKRRQRRRRHADGLPLEGREGGRRDPRRSDGPGPRGRGESSTGAPAAAAPEEKEHTQAGGISPPGTQPGAVAVPHTRRASPEDDDDDGAGRVPRRTWAGGPAATPQTTDVR